MTSMQLLERSAIAVSLEDHISEVRSVLARIPVDDIERVVEHRRGFAIVKKVKPLVRRAVRDLDPRSDAA